MGFSDIFKSKKQREADEAARRANERVQETRTNAMLRQKRREMEKKLATIDGKMEGLMAKAAESKQAGYGDIYRQCVTMIKVTRGRKMQITKFLHQMDMMEMVKDISKESTELLGCMRQVMGSIGKVTLDQGMMARTTQDIMAIEQTFEQESAALDTYMEQLGLSFPDSDDGMADVGILDADIEAEIERYIMQRDLNGVTVPTAPGTGTPATGTPGGVDNLRRFL